MPDQITKEKPRRPISVWIAQILLLTLGCACGISFFMRLLDITELPPLARSEIYELAWLSCMRFGLSLLFLSGFWGMVKRKPYGRWTGVAGFLICVVMVGLAGYFTFDRELYPEIEDVLVWVAAIGIFLVPFFLVVFILVFSRRVNEFFSPPAGPEPGLNPEPPPPPSFDADYST